MIRNSGEHVGEPCLRIDVVELAGDDQRIHGRRTRAAAVGAGEQPVLASERDTSERALGGVVVELEAAIVCGSAWKRDPGSGVIGVEKGPIIPVV